MKLDRLAIVVLFLFVALFFAKDCLAVSFEGKVVRVLDGDTIDVLYDGAPRRIRLQEIDAPEIFWTILTMSNGVSGVVNETQSL